jgi:RecB family endonuclease NucS
VGPEVVDEEENDADRFVYESDLRDYLAKNLRIIESGMTLWSFPNGQSAVEFDLDDRRRIDILARDAHGVPVVIELKVDRGHERVIGQALFYRESVKLKLNVARARIVIVAREISQELRIASKGISDIDLHEYKLSMTLQKV